MQRDKIIQAAETGTYEGWEITELERVFSIVRDPNDWKAPIVRYGVSGEWVLPVVAAIKFYTGTVPTVTLDPATMQYTIQSIGYRAGPCR
jgi:hypothetical protein